jgi:cyclic pyranopterin phosphate synthase
MPEQGLHWLERKQLMTYEEMLRVCSLLVKMGVNKIRITGGEPFVRKDIMHFLTGLSKLDGLHQLSITTNGVLTAPLVPELKKIGVRSVNLSLDTLDRNRFFQVTRRDELPQVMETLEALLKHDMDVRINAVVMDGKNTDDIIPLVLLSKSYPVTVRFIEEMPFNGVGDHYTGIPYDHVRIMSIIRSAFPSIIKVADPPHSTAYNYHIPGHKGNVGVIAAYSRSFCGTCNRIRITPEGMLRTCLYDNGVMNLKDLMRFGYNDDQLKESLITAFLNKAKDGWEAEQLRKATSPLQESMATIGG